MLLGRGRFTADLNRPGLLHAAFVRSPHAHARINAIDVTAARHSPGVQDVLTAVSLGDPYLLSLLEREEFVPTRMPILAGDKVRFVGEPVAVVIADDAYQADGTILALDAEIDCDTGAYSAFPFTCAVEPLMASTELPGVYKVPAYRARGRAIATNKAPAAPYRGVSRPQIVLVMERLMDKAAEALTLDPLAVRRRNLISAGDFPYTGVNGITWKPGRRTTLVAPSPTPVTWPWW